MCLSGDHVLKCDLHSYNMQYSGQSALHIAVLVAFTQLIPEHQVQILGVLKARVKVGRSSASMSGSSTVAYIDFPYDLPYIFYRDDDHRVPMPVYPHTIWMVCVMDVSAFLQEERRRSCGRRHLLRRPIRDIFICQLVPSASAVRALPAILLPFLADPHPRTAILCHYSRMPPIPLQAVCT